MPILTGKNIHYGPPLVNQKYAPLLDPEIVSKESKIYSGLLLNRWRLLSGLNLLPKPLALVVPNWATTIAAEAGKKPPLVVVSSNRSAWIKAGIEAADVQPENLKPFADAADLKAMTAVRGQTVSPPIYCPSRIGSSAPRNVYVVVHAHEYVTYQKNLAGKDITVVGWQFRPPAGVGAPELSGFGASRFAAVEFCKVLRAQAAAAAAGVAPWNYAWLIDDNVVALTSFAGYEAVEGAMTAEHACAGFQGGTAAENFLTNKTWANKELKDGRGKKVGALPPSAPPGIIQQAALWNIKYFKDNHLNFGPAYIASAEDISLVNYFNRKKIPYFYYGGIGVRKEETTYDPGRGGRNVKAARERLAALFAVAEGADPADAVPPPPINVTPRKAEEDGGTQLLADFVVNRVLPNCLMSAQAADAAVQNNAKCQAVEQITHEAIKAGYVSDDALNSTFKINGADDQEVRRVDKP
jgi:hypothetical protein